MTSVPQPESPGVSEKSQENENTIQRERTPRDGPMDSGKNIEQDDGDLDSDLSDHGAPKEFKEGGYGWYVWGRESRRT